MSPSTGSSASSSGSEEEDEEMVEEVEDFDMDSIGGLSLLDNLDNMILDFDSSLDMDLLGGTNVENQNHHLGAVESPRDSRTSEGPEANATSPEIVWLANHCMSNQSQGPTQVSIEDIIQIILMRFVPHRRGCGFTGASTNELIGNFNASLPGQRPLVPLASNPATAKESSKSPPTLTKTGKWKRKNRPTYATGLKKYNKRKKKNTVRENKTKAQDDLITKLAKHKKDDDGSAGGGGGESMGLAV